MDLDGATQAMATPQAGLRTHPREALLDLLERIARALEAAGRDAEPARAVARRVQENTFDIVVVGQYKRGKTTFINALLGADLLPTAVVPLTSIATRIFYAPRPAAQIRFLDGRCEEVPVEDLALYITERGNPGNARGVAVAEVGFPSEALKDGTILTDTPGIASVFEHNTKAAVEYIPQADAAIFLVNADPPISEAERDFLTAARPYLAKLFFVQNKIDQVSPADQEESLAFTRRVIQGAVGEDHILIYPLSARLALEAKQTRDREKLARSRFGEFERELRRFLQRAKGQMLLRSAAGKAGRLLAELRSGAELERTALDMDLRELAAKAEAFQRHLDDVERARFEDKAVLRAQVDRLVAECIDARLEAFQSENLPKMRAALAQYAREQQRSSLGKLRHALRGEAMRLIQEALLAWGGAEEAGLAEALKRLLQRFTEQTNALLGKIAADCQALFGVRFDLFVPEEELPADSRFFIADWFVADGIDLAVGIALSVMPRAFVRRRILAEVSRGMAEKLDMQCGRLRYDFLRRIQDRVREFTKAMDEHFVRAIASIREVVERSLALRRDREEAAALARGEVAGRLAGIAGMEADLAAIAARIGGEA